MASSFITSSTRRPAPKGRYGRGRPSPGPPIGLRLYSDILSSLDRWIEQQPEPKPKRTEAIRELLRLALKNY
jgi:hypothetical protein